MINQVTIQNTNRIYYRLIALWVICEAFAGGILHSIKLPFTGMIISALAVMCIILIAWHVPVRGAIIKATIIVATFKLLLSPQSPGTAYIAVFFQGLIGELLFLNKRFFRLSAILLAVLSLVESAIQRIIVLLFMGSRFWQAIDQAIQKLLNQKHTTNFGYKIMTGYVLIHAIVGILIGIYLSVIVKKTAAWKNAFPQYLFTPVEQQLFEQRTSKKKTNIKAIFIIIWLLLLALLIQNYFDPKASFITLSETSALIIRFILILLGWYLFIIPISALLIKKILAGERIRKKKEINAVMNLLPGTKFIFTKSWQLSAAKKGYARLGLFFKILLINVLTEETDISKNT